MKQILQNLMHSSLDIMHTIPIIAAGWGSLTLILQLTGQDILIKTAEAWWIFADFETAGHDAAHLSGQTHAESRGMADFALTLRLQVMMRRASRA